MTQRRYSRLGIIVLGLLLASIAAIALVGCAALERAADDVHYITTANATPTTQPGAMVEAAREVVQGAAQSNPTIGLIVGLVSLVSGVVAGAAGGKKSAKRQAHTVIAEIVGDIRAYNQPNTPWTEATRKLLIDLGYEDEARVFGGLGVGN